MKLCFQGRVCFFVLLSRKIEQPSRRTASDRQKGSILIFPRFLFFVSFFFVSFFGMLLGFSSVSVDVEIG